MKTDSSSYKRATNDNIYELLHIFISGRTKRFFEWKRSFVLMGQKKKKKSKKKQ